MRNGSPSDLDRGVGEGERCEVGDVIDHSK
jgi:hypothetical protein